MLIHHEGTKNTVDLENNFFGQQHTKSVRNEDLETSQPDSAGVLLTKNGFPDLDLSFVFLRVLRAFVVNERSSFAVQ
jgi:hypothetical protein